MAMVRPAPSSKVFFTSATELRMPVDASRTISTFTPAGSNPCMSSTALRTPSSTPMVFSPCALTMSIESARSPLMSAALSSSCWPSAISATCPSVTALPPRRATIRLRKSAGVPMRARICTIFSWPGVTTDPAGSSWFSLCRARITWSAPTFCASSASRSRKTLISRFTPPTSVACPTPPTFSRRFLITWSASVVSSRSGRFAEVTATDTTGLSSGLKREIFGSLISARNVGRSTAIFSRTSLAAALASMARSNCTTTTDRPS